MEKPSDASKARTGQLRRVVLSDQEIEAARTTLRVLAGPPEESRPEPADDWETKIEKARRMLAFRQRRMEILDLRAEAPFAILLALYANEPWEPAITLTRLTLLSSVGMSSTLRWLEGLLAEKLVERGDDPDDLRKTILRLTSKGRGKMDELFDESVQSPPLTS